MKKFSYLIIALVSLVAFILLALVFVFFYVELGQAFNKVTQNSLFYTLSHIDYDSFFRVLLIVLLYMFILDTIILLIKRSVKRVQGKDSEKGRNFFVRYWQNNEKIHLSFILLTLFVTLSISAPSTVMNSFTAIVSISVLVSSLTKKIGK